MGRKSIRALKQSTAIKMLRINRKYKSKERDINVKYTQKRFEDPEFREAIRISNPYNNPVFKEVILWASNKRYEDPDIKVKIKDVSHIRYQNPVHDNIF